MRLRTSLAAVGGSLALAAGIPAALGDDGQVREVSIPGKVFAPAQLQVLVGDTVVWRNGDVTDHTVTSDDGAFDSGYLGPGLTFSLAFPKLGRYSYHCTIHKFMHGEIVVVPVALQAPAHPVVLGRKGRSPGPRAHGNPQRDRCAARRRCARSSAGRPGR